MKKTTVLILAIAAVAGSLVLRSAWARMNLRIADLHRTCEELRELLQAPEQTPFGQQEIQAPLVMSPGDPARSVAFEAELRRRLDEVTALQSNAAVLIHTLSAKRVAEPSELPLPEQKERAQAYVQVYDRHLQEARQNAMSLNAQAKHLLLSLNIPADVASLDGNKALASVDLQQYWPYFEARKELELQNMMVERLRMRILQETVDMEVLEAQLKAAK